MNTCQVYIELLIIESDRNVNYVSRKILQLLGWCKVTYQLYDTDSISVIFEKLEFPTSRKLHNKIYNSDHVHDLISILKRLTVPLNSRRRVISFDSRLELDNRSSDEVANQALR